MQVEGLIVPEKAKTAIAEYRQDGDDIGAFLAENLVHADGNRLKTSELFHQYYTWTKTNGFRAMNNPDFVGELRRRYEVKRDCAKGNVVIGFDLKK